MTRERVGVFGGSFNPPHIAHVLACVYAVDMHQLDRVLVVPAFQHPFAKALEPYAHRVSMCELAFAHLPRASVSRVEEELGGESRTLRTLTHLAAQHSHWDMRLVIGADILREAHKWFGFEEIQKLAPPLVLGRAGVSERAYLPEVSSSDVRSWIAAGDPRFEEMVTPAVRAYIATHALYR